MPYQGQKASKGGHADLIRNPDVEAFLNDCVYMREPSDDEGAAIASQFLSAPKGSGLPNCVVASDASPYSDPISNRFPSTQVGYVKVSLIAFDMNNFKGLIEAGSSLIDPFKVAAFHRDAEAVSFTLPGSNVRYKGAKTVKDGFRLAVYEQLSHDRTSFGAQGITAKDTLLSIEDGKIEIDKCPACGAKHAFEFDPKHEQIQCPACSQIAYVTDYMRIHEQISDYGDNSAAITRFMNAAEHLLVATLVKTLADSNLTQLSSMAFIIDGPLALFGQPAKVHSPLMRFYHTVSDILSKKGYEPPLLIGLQKEGQVMEHARSLDRFLKPNTFRVIDDDYRARYINGGPTQLDNFGHETYYGQDFILKTESGRIFTVGIPYPFPDKTNRSVFAKQKSDISRYAPWLGRAFDLVRHLEFDLYESAVVPVALAHRHASISLVPGGKMLDLLTKKHVGNQT
ncbi:hypothetical protein CCC_03159 [Paramagnetospirillum magnetotacticum MS-1]|uniref:NurA domain-containing protein n=1 Tax=Paramagnetospirillum magnetotacticum MS-1 TaxID=272627 RepID=A0A0C2V666_PARME|nr:DNA double-strand break repair nuclease NurA [Paramagnetospirillum magnetotacticum]KIM00557.1 hypothetical protein CCC_03159 [Paramagnetospirillum magnetotacticum MS-1]